MWPWPSGLKLKLRELARYLPRPLLPSVITSQRKEWSMRGIDLLQIKTLPYLSSYYFFLVNYLITTWPQQPPQNYQPHSFLQQSSYRCDKSVSRLGMGWGKREGVVSLNIQTKTLVSKKIKSILTFGNSYNFCLSPP